MTERFPIIGPLPLFGPYFDPDVPTRTGDSYRAGCFCLSPGCPECRGLAMDVDYPRYSVTGKSPGRLQMKTLRSRQRRAAGVGA